jgi:hypothetical protein
MLSWTTTKTRKKPMTTKMIDSTFAIPTICTSCHASLDAVTNAEDTKRPEAGDFTLCCACGALMVFTEGLSVAPATLMDIPAQYRAHFARAIYLIKEMQREKMGERSTEV